MLEYTLIADAYMHVPANVSDTEPTVHLSVADASMRLSATVFGTESTHTFLSQDTGMILLRQSSAMNSSTKFLLRWCHTSSCTAGPWMK